MSPRNLNPDPTLLNYPDIMGEDGEYQPINVIIRLMRDNNIFPIYLVIAVLSAVLTSGLVLGCPLDCHRSAIFDGSATVITQPNHTLTGRKVVGNSLMALLCTFCRSVQSIDCADCRPSIAHSYDRQTDQQNAQ